jgi:primosomal protein N'
MPDHPVIAALAKGDPLSFLKTELANRAAYGYPPAGEVIIVETRGEGVVDPDPAIRAAGPGVAILGPAVREHGRRWLVQGADLGPFRLALRPVVQRLRDSGLRVRIDVDPIDL